MDISKKVFFLHFVIKGGILLWSICHDNDGGHYQIKEDFAVSSSNLMQRLMALL